VWIFSLLMLFVTIAALYRIEVWPITGVPMYSQYRSPSFPLPRNFRELEERAISWIESGYPINLMWQNTWTSLLLVNTNVVKTSADIAAFPESAVNLRSYAEDMKNKYVIIRQLWNRTIWTVAALFCSGNKKFAEEWMENNMKLWRSFKWKVPNWAAEGGVVWLVAHCQTEHHVLAKIKWN